MEQFAWKNDERDRNSKVEEILKLKEKERRSKYYKKKKKTIDAKQKKRDKERDRKSYSTMHYQKNRERINEANKARYRKNIEKRRLESLARYYKNRDAISARRKELRQQRKEAE